MFRTIAIDIETTGLDPMEDDVIEFAAHTDGMTTDLFIDSDRESDEGAFAIHGLTRDMVRERSGGRTRREALESVGNLIARSGCVVVAHNARFVMTMILANMVRSDCDDRLVEDMHSVVPLDTMVMDRMIHVNDRSRSRSLASLCGSYGIRRGGGAKADSRAIHALADREMDALMYEGVGWDDLPGLVARRAVEQQEDFAIWVESKGGDPEMPGYPYDPRVVEALELRF